MKENEMINFVKGSVAGMVAALVAIGVAFAIPPQYEAPEITDFTVSSSEFAEEIAACDTTKLNHGWEIEITANGPVFECHQGWMPLRHYHNQ